MHAPCDSRLSSIYSWWPILEWITTRYRKGLRVSPTHRLVRFQDREAPGMRLVLISHCGDSLTAEEYHSRDPTLPYRT